MTLTLPLTARRVEVQPYPLAVAALLAVGVVLRFWGLGAHYLSYDETFTLLAARLPLARLVAATAGDVHPPLSYLVSWGAVRLLGENALALRLPSAVMGALALPLLLALAKRLGLSRAATLAGLALFALMPFEVHYAQDGRMYALLQLAVLTATLAAFERRWWLMGLALTVAVWTHNYGLFYLGVIGALAFVREMGAPIFVPVVVPGALRPMPVPYANPRAACLAALVPALAWLPWLSALRGQMQTVAGGYWLLPLSLGQALYPLHTLLWGVHLPSRLAGPAALVGFAVVTFAVVKALRLKEQRALLWLVLAPLLLAAAVSLLWKPIYLFRGFIGSAAPLALLVGWALTARTSARNGAWAALMIGPLLLAGIAARGPALARATGENARAVEVVAAGWQPGDIVYHGNVGSLTGFLVTAPEYMPNYLMPVQPGSVGVLTPQTRAAMGFCEGPLGAGQLIADCGADGPVGAGWRRAWLVWGASQTISGVEDLAVAALLEAYPHTKILDIRDVYHGPQPVEGGIWLLTP